MTHYYYDALSPLEYWTPEQLQQLKDLDIKIEVFNEDKYPNQPDMKVIGTKENLIKFIESVHDGDLHILTDEIEAI